MILMSIFQSVEFYVISAVLAAAVVAASVKPSGKGAARTYLYGGTLVDDGPSAASDAPSIALEVSEDGRDVILERRGLAGVGFDDGAYSVAVSVAGFDVTIDERLTFGKGFGTPATGAVVNLECLAQERYHILYRSETLGRNCAFTLRLRPGVRLERELV